MTAAPIIDDCTRLETRETGHRTDPLRSVAVSPALVCGKRGQLPGAGSAGRLRPGPSSVAGISERQRRQLPSFAPLLEELEIAGWSANRPAPSGNFHDWRLLGSGRVLVTVGHAIDPESLDSLEAALVAQAAWTAIRAHACHADDAGMLLSLAAQTLWPAPAETLRASAVVALIDTAGGQVSIAMAGDCIVWRVRAATSEQIAVRQPLLGGAADFAYLSHSIQLSLRERLILTADDTPRRPAKLATTMATSLSQLDAESHRRMTAADAVALVRKHYERKTQRGSGTTASVAAIRRR